MKPFEISVTCPNCGQKTTYEITPPKPELKTADVTCLNCGHKWRYVGALTRRVECPKCGSTKNDVNRQLFGTWKPPAMKVKP